MVKEPWLKDLLMESCAVEAAIERTGDVVDQILLGGSGVDAVGIKALIENQSLEYLLAVDDQCGIVKREASHAKIALDPVLTVGENQVVKSALADLPQMKFGELQGQGTNTAVSFDGGDSYRFSVPKGFCR